MSAVIAVLVAASPVPATASVPISLVVLSDGVRRYGITLTVDGRPLVAGLDSGSTGLRILPAGLGDRARTMRGPRSDYHYGSGVAFSGAIVRLPVGFGDLPAQEVSVQRVDAISCTDRTPDCAASKIPIDQFRVQGDGIAGQGFEAILGLGLAHDAVANPLEAMGIRDWIIELPRNAGETGQLLINPDAATMARYRLVATEQNGNEVPACIGATGARPLCAPAMLDTGAVGLRVLGGRPSDILANGTDAVIRIGRDSSGPAMAITVGRRDEASAMRLYPPRAAGGTTLNLGIAPFLRWSVLYRADRNEIGVVDR